MITSMTGYGRAEVASASQVITAEVRSVNHRFCDVVVRLPRSLSSVEDELKKLIQQHCARGRIELTVSVTGARALGKRVSLDHELARQYHGVLRDLKKHLRLAGSVDLALLMTFRDIVTFEEQPLDERELAESARQATVGALAALNEMRRREGRSLSGDIKDRLAAIDALVGGIQDRAPLVAQEHFTRMKARVDKLLGTADLDHERAYQELALYADRADITEELTRLRSHLGQFAATLTGREPVGRTMDFVLQEMGREVNTIGAKANDAEISASVVKLKGELEKVREQVQNIE